MSNEKSHDILKRIGMPLMIGGAGIYAVTGKNLARNIGAVGAIMSMSWVVVDMIGYLDNRSKGNESM